MVQYERTLRDVNLLQMFGMLKIYQQTDRNLYLPILHLPRVELHCKLQEKFHRVTGPLMVGVFICHKLYVALERVSIYFFVSRRELDYNQAQDV